MASKRQSKKLAPRSITPGMDEYRWIRARQLKIPLDRIAADDGVSIQAIEKSIRKIEKQRSRLTLAELETAEIGGLLTGVKEEHDAIREAMGATRRVQLLDDRGKKVTDEAGHPLYVEEPDHDTRLNAVRARTELLNALQPKGSGVSVNMNQQTFIAQQGARRGVESRIIEFNSAREKQLPQPAEEAEYEEVDEI